MGNVQFTGPRQIYVRSLLEEINAQRYRGAPSASSVRLSVFKHHSKPYGELGAGQLAALRQRAAVYNAKKLETLDDSRSHIISQMALIRERQQQEQRHGLVNHMDSIRFTPADYEKVIELWPQHDGDHKERALFPPWCSSSGGQTF